MDGTEWIVEAQGCSSDALRDLATLRSLFERIIREVQLRPVGDTQWHQFPRTGGITGLCLLSESHLACHTFPEFRSLCLNVFCCVPRADLEFESVLKQMFEAESVSVRRLARPFIPAEDDSQAVRPATRSSVPVGSAQG